MSLFISTCRFFFCTGRGTGNMGKEQLYQSSRVLARFFFLKIDSPAQNHQEDRLTRLTVK